MNSDPRIPALTRSSQGRITKRSGGRVPHRFYGVVPTSSREVLVLVVWVVLYVWMILESSEYGCGRIGMGMRLRMGMGLLTSTITSALHTRAGVHFHILRIGIGISPSTSMRDDRSERCKQASSGALRILRGAGRLSLERVRSERARMARGRSVERGTWVWSEWVGEYGPG